ncbi:MAG: LacI family transcriptional regulator [Propionibacteriaceae bacterium]|nr:LacI family transcriptional regulator [Propionibacteriaceae bacterium]
MELRGRATIRDVAERSGVSTTTVSHVLNEVPGKRISEQTRVRVTQAAADLHYRPNKLAQGLRTQRTGLIGFLSDHVSTTPFAGRMILGAQDAAAEAASLLVLLNSGGDPEVEEREVEALLERQVDGIVYAAFYHRVVTPPQGLRRGPAVLLDARGVDGEFSSVIPDEVGGSRAGVEQLLAAGHRRIGFVNNQDDIPARTLRLAGYRQALEVYGVPFDHSLMVEREPSARGGFDGAMALLSGIEMPTALFCATDRMAMGAYQAAQELSLSIPRDLSIVGFDDQELVADSLRPGLTTVALPHYQMGQWAVRRLLEQIDAPESQPTHALIPCPVVRRESVGPPSRAVRGLGGEPQPA